MPSPCGACPSPAPSGPWARCCWLLIVLSGRPITSTFAVFRSVEHCQIAESDTPRNSSGIFGFSLPLELRREHCSGYPPPAHRGVQTRFLSLVSGLWPYLTTPRWVIRERVGPRTQAPYPAIAHHTHGPPTVLWVHCVGCMATLPVGGWPLEVYAGRRRTGPPVAGQGPVIPTGLPLPRTDTLTIQYPHGPC